MRDCALGDAEPCSERGTHHPAGQGAVFELAPPLQKTPAEQPAQVDARLCPVALENVPGAQLAFARPPPGQNCPAGHATEFDEAPPPQRMPELHCEQLERPGVPAKKPGAHSVQFAALFAPSALELVPRGHDRHEAALVAPPVLEYRPCAQGVHADWPAVSA